MGKRICLTAEQRKEESAKQMRERLASGLAAYKNKNRLTNKELGDELGICDTSVAKILNASDVCLPVSVTHTLLCIAGYDITKTKISNA